MIYLLDSNVCIQFINGNSATVKANFEKHTVSELALCSIVKAELLFGARKSKKTATNLQTLTAFFAPLQSLPFDDRCAETYGQIRANLEAKGQKIGFNDVFIAAIAVTYDVTLVTNNTREFGRVDGLSLVDWQQ